MRMSRLALAAAAASAAVLTSALTPAAAADTDVVHPGRVGADWHTGDTRPPGTFAFDDTYGGAHGTTSALVLSTPDNIAKVQMLSDDWAGTELADIAALEYDTYRDDASAAGPSLPALNIRVDLTGDGVADRYLVFEPYQAYGNGAIQVETWQHWDALDGGDAEWWMSGAASPCPQSNPCAWDDIVADFPAATIEEGPDAFQGSIGFNQGSFNAGLLAAADTLHIATGDRDVVYDFQADVVLTSKDECKNGGWATSTAPDFRNQGQCVSYFASKGKARG
jgi:hypothetical protein